VPLEGLIFAPRL